MKLKNNISHLTVNILFLLFPLTLILGNFATNINLLLFIIFSFIFFKKEILSLKFNYFDKIIFVFFLYSLITLALNYLESYLKNNIFSELIFYKTIFFFRYFVFYLVIRILLQKKIINLQWFYNFAIFCVLFLCFDIFFQFIFKIDIFGIKPASSRHYSGLFGEEPIAGGYLQRFSFLAIIIFFSIKEKKYLINKTFFQLFIFTIIFLGILLSGNRVPLIIYVFVFFIYLFLLKDLRKLILKFIIFLIFIFYFFFTFNQNLKIHIKEFYFSSTNLVLTIFSKKPLVKDGPYTVELSCSKKFIKMNPVFGGGIKSYRTHVGYCGSHSHNYYIEIFVELGFVGLCIFLYLMINLGKLIYLKSKIIEKLNNISTDVKTPILLIFIAEFFPIRTTGSFFSTGNATFIFIILALLITMFNNKKAQK